MNKILIPIIALLAVVIGIYFVALSPSAKAKSAAKKSLQEFSDAVAAKDRAKVKTVLGDVLDDKVNVQLKMETISIIQQVPPVTLNFDKPGFIAFIDSALGNLTDYNYEYRIGVVALAPDKKSANVKFTSKEWGDGMGAYGTTQIANRFSSNTDCDSTVNLVDNKVKVAALTCAMQYRAVPKADALDKVKDELKQQVDQINKATAVPPQNVAPPSPTP